MKRSLVLGTKNTGLETKTVRAEFKVADGADGDKGIVEALVSVFDNVDYGGDRVIKGAFTDTLQEWKDSGDPIPFIWSHQWSDPAAHIGVVLDAKETNEGLWIKAQVLDLDEPFGAKVFRLLKERRVVQFSFGYETRKAAYVEEEREDGSTKYIRELHSVGLFEVGPTLVGMNPGTQLLEAASHPEPPAPTPAPATPDATPDAPKNVAGDTGDSIDPERNARVLALLTADRHTKE